MPKNIRLRLEYGCYPLWDIDNPGNLRIENFDISDELKKRLNEWADKYNQWFDIDGVSDKTPRPPELRKVIREEIAAFDREGASIWLDLREELGEEYQVVYAPFGQKKKLNNPEELDQCDFWTS